MLFDRDKYGIWRIGNELAAAICKATLKGSHLTLKYTEGENQSALLFDGEVTELYRIVEIDNVLTEVYYTSVDDFLAYCGDFFVKALVREGYPRTIYKAIQKNEITDTNIHSLFSNSYKGVGRLIPANTLKVGDIIFIKMNGLFSTLSGHSSENQIKLGNTILESSSVTYLNNRTNYYLETEIIITIRAIGQIGKAIIQGRDITQSSNTQYTVSMLPRQSLAPIDIDTTVDNLFDMIFKWNTSGGSLIVSNAIIQIL